MGRRRSGGLPLREGGPSAGFTRVRSKARAEFGGPVSYLFSGL